MLTMREVIAADGVRLNTRSDGAQDAPCLLLLNSLGTDLSMWANQVACWSENHRVLRFDQRGHGASEAPSGAYTIEQLGLDALAVLDAYEVARADVCGLSLGGLVALWVAGRAPDRIRRAVFADTAARVGTEQAWRTRAATVRTDGMIAVVDQVLDRFFSPAFRAGDDPVVADLESVLRAASVDGYAGSCELLADTDLHDLAPQVQARSLVIVGTADEATPPADARALHVLLPNAELVELPGAGHLANLEQPARFETLVREFLAADDLESVRE